MKINKSAARAMDLLLLLAETKTEMTLLEIEQALQIPKSSTFELVYTLVEKGFIVQEDKKFTLGINAFLVGLGYSDKLNLVQVAKPVLFDLAKISQETVFLGKYMNRQIIYVDKHSEYADMASTCKIGSTKGLYYTALGKSILAKMPEKEVEAYFSETAIEAFTENTITTYEKMKNEIHLIQQRGYAMELGEGKSDAFCIAAPILDYKSEVIAAISITAPRYKTEEMIEKLSNRIQTSALSISAKLGYTSNHLY